MQLREYFSALTASLQLLLRRCIVGRRPDLCSGVQWAKQLTFSHQKGRERPWSWKLYPPTHARECGECECISNQNEQFRWLTFLTALSAAFIVPKLSGKFSREFNTITSVSHSVACRSVTAVTGNSIFPVLAMTSKDQNNNSPTRNKLAINRLVNVGFWLLN